MTARLDTLPEPDDIAEMLQTASYGTLAKRLGCSPGTLKSRMSRAGLKKGFMDEDDRPRKLPADDDEFLIAFTELDGAVNAIAERFGCTPSAVRHRIARMLK